MSGKPGQGKGRKDSLETIEKRVAHRRGRTYEEIYGLDRAGDEKRKRSDGNVSFGSRPWGAENLVHDRAGKTYDEIYGSERAAKEAQKRSDGNRGKTRSSDQRAKQSETGSQVWADRTDEERQAWGKAWSAAQKISPNQFESLVRDTLLELGIIFEMQVPVIGYVVDFLIDDTLILEADGDFWHTGEAIEEHDRRKDKRLREAGYRVARVRESDVYSDPIASVSKALQDLGLRLHS